MNVAAIKDGRTREILRELEQRDREAEQAKRRAERKRRGQRGCARFAFERRSAASNDTDDPPERAA